MKKNKFFIGLTLGFFAFFGAVMAATFSDITGHWAEDDLMWAIENGLLQGDGVVEGQEKTLRPNDPVTRAELATILRRYDNGTDSVGGISNNTNDFEATVNGITWIGREMLVNETDAIYQVVRVDELGKETVIHEEEFGHFGGDVEWSFSNEGQDLVIEIRYYGLHGFTSRQLAFKNNEEVVRSYHEVYLGYEEDLSFELPGSAQYNVKLMTSEACQGQVSDIDNFVAPQVELLGVEISSEKGTQAFDLDNPEMVDCPVVDGYFETPGPQNINTTPNGIWFELPHDDEAFISKSDLDEEVEVYFNSM